MRSAPITETKPTPNRLRWSPLTLPSTPTDFVDGLISYGATVHTCLEAAELAAKNGVECEVVDLRTLVPMDVAAILAAVRKCGRVVVVHEAPKTCGVGAEIAALIAEQAIEVLEAPVLRVTGFDVPFPYALEHVYMPTAERVLAAVEKVVAF